MERHKISINLNNNFTVILWGIIPIFNHLQSIFGIHLSMDIIKFDTQNFNIISTYI